MVAPYCIRAAAVLLAASLPLAAAAQPPPGADADTGEARYTVFLRGAALGTEAVAVTRDGSGWTVTSSGRLNQPVDVTLRRLQLRYGIDWHSLEMTLDAMVRGEAQSFHTVVNGTTAISEITVAGQARTVTAATTAEILLPNPFFAPFEALARRLRTAPRGSTITALMPVQDELSVLVGESTSETIETPGQTIVATRTQLTMTPQLPATPPISAEVWADERGRLLRVSIPGQALELVREDLASVATRRVPISRPNDEQVTISDNGFILKGTLSRPASPSTTRLPAVLLVSSGDPGGVTDRDELLFDIPIFGQLADAIADAGFIVVRYDKRGVGQSGGREEAATLADYADDVRAAVRFLANRKDVDPKRIAVVGYGGGGTIAMLAAAKEKRIGAVALVATPGVSGTEVNLDQVRRALERTNKSAAEKQQTIELQRSIQQAVLTGAGWQGLEPYRRQADTPLFQSILAFDPAKVMKELRQPLLVLQGELDSQVPLANASRLSELALQRKAKSPVQVVTLPGINHLLVPATTGETDEYPQLKDRHVSAVVSMAISNWLRTNFAR